MYTNCAGVTFLSIARVMSPLDRENHNLGHFFSSQRLGNLQSIAITRVVRVARARGTL